MTALDIRCAGQSISLPYTDTGTVPAPLLAQASQRQAWTLEKFVFEQDFYRRSPWRQIRQKKGNASHRNLIGYDAGTVGRLMDLGHTPSLIQVSVGGGVLNQSTLAVDWLPPNGVCWQQLLLEWNAAVASTNLPVSQTAPLFIMFAQGQSDAASAPYSAAYGANLLTFTAAVRAFFGARVCKFVISQISSTMVLGGATPGQIAAVRAGQAAFVAGDGGLSALVDETPFPTFDGLHPTEAGSIAMGVAYADAIQGLLP